jgi:hypothetical protein
MIDATPRSHVGGFTVYGSLRWNVVNLPFLTLTLSLGRWCSAGAGVVAAGRDRRVGRRRPGAARQRWLPSCSPRPRSQAGGPGKGAAFRKGFAAASGDIIAAFDADGSTDPAEIRGYVGAVCAGADLPRVRGSFKARGRWTLHRKMGDRALVLLVRLFFGGRCSDLCYGYNAFWVDVLPGLELGGDGFEIETVMNVHALRAGLRVWWKSRASRASGSSELPNSRHS